MKFKIKLTRRLKINIEANIRLMCAIVYNITGILRKMFKKWSEIKLNACYSYKIFKHVQQFQ